MIEGEAAQSPQRRVGRPRGLHHDTRRRIIDAARTLFAQHGFSATSNRQIADQVGITAGAVYYHFRSKEKLLGAVQRSVTDHIYGRLDAAVEAVEADGLVAQLDAAFDALVDIYRDRSIVGFVAASSLKAVQMPEVRRVDDALEQRSRSFFGGLIGEALRAGEINEDVDLAAVEDLMSAIMLGLSQVIAGHFDVERHACTVTALKALIRGELFAPRPAL